MSSDAIVTSAHRRCAPSSSARVSSRSTAGSSATSGRAASSRGRKELSAIDGLDLGDRAEPQCAEAVGGARSVDELEQRPLRPDRPHVADRRVLLAGPAHVHERPALGERLAARAREVGLVAVDDRIGVELPELRRALERGVDGELEAARA